MNRFVFAFVLLAASAALAEAAWVRRDPPRVEWFGRPSYVDVPGVGRVWDPEPATLLANGWEAFEYGGNPLDAVLDYSAPVAVRDMTQDELDARAAAQAEAQTNAEYQATLPVPMPTGVEVPWVVFLDATNRTKGIAMELTTNNVPIYYEFHASPVDWAKVDSNRTAAIAKRDLRVQAVKNAKSQGGGLAALGARVAALEAMLGVE